MRPSLLLLTSTAGHLATAATASLSGYKGPKIYGSFNEIDECEMHQAIECLHEQICARRKVPYHGKIRCTIGSSVAYLCNYRSNHDKETEGEKPGGQLSCGHEAMYEAWRQIRIAKHSQTGWWYSGRDKLTYGFDRSCRGNECDNGWREGSAGEQCTNIGAKHKEWTFDFVSDFYPNYTAKWIRPLPELDDENEPVYFLPWQDGNRQR